MISSLENQNKKNINNYILLGIPFIFILACLFHFMYEATGKTIVSAIFFPVNESIFEHLKLVLYPTIIYWIVLYLFIKGNYKIPFKKWLIGLCFSIVSSIVSILFFYYVFKSAFNISSLFWHIIIVLISAIIGQIIGLHVFNNIKYNSLKFLICLIIIATLVIIFTKYTFFPPHLPLFYDFTKNIYGLMIILF